MGYSTTFSSNNNTSINTIHLKIESVLRHFAEPHVKRLGDTNVIRIEDAMFPMMTSDETTDFIEAFYMDMMSYTNQVVTLIEHESLAEVYPPLVYPHGPMII